MKKIKKVIVSVSLDEDVHEKGQQYASVQRKSFSALVNNALARLFGLLKGDLDERKDEE